VGTLLYFSLIHSIGPTRTVLTTYFFPLVGVILGVLFLNETPTWNMLVGGAMILSGIGLVNYQWRKNSDERSAVNV
jgi:drug/metabolite transporter (DMT)-like permease